MIAVIGAGAMGEALMAGWIAAGTSPDEIVAVDQDTDRLARLRERRGVRSVEVSGVSVAEVVVVAVKPVAKAGKKNIFSGRILEIEGLPDLKVEQAFELTDASAERSAAGCTVKLNKEPIMIEIGRASCRERV